VVLFDVAVTGAPSGQPGSVTIEALPGASCTIDGGPAAPGTPAATPPTPVTVTVACTRDGGSASVDVLVPAT